MDTGGSRTFEDTRRRAEAFLAALEAQWRPLALALLVDSLRQLAALRRA